jgi:hypothetical protein
MGMIKKKVSKDLTTWKGSKWAKVLRKNLSFLKPERERDSGRSANSQYCLGMNSRKRSRSKTKKLL